jgi:hypothetical protein
MGREGAEAQAAAVVALDRTDSARWSSSAPAAMEGRTSCLQSAGVSTSKRACGKSIVTAPASARRIERAPSLPASDAKASKRLAGREYRGRSSATLVTRAHDCGGALPELLGEAGDHRVIHQLLVT